jgi:hypothetical protein
MNPSAVSNIRIKGCLEPEWSDWDDNLEVAPGAENRTTLFGRLRKIHNLNLDLNSGTRIENNTAD